jgi:hypothetical protein
VIQQLTESTGASQPLYKSRLSRTEVCQPTSLLSRSSHPRRCQPTSLNASCLVLIVPADLTIRPVISAQFASQPLALVPRSDPDANLSILFCVCCDFCQPTSLSRRSGRFRFGRPFGFAQGVLDRMIVDVLIFQVFMSISASQPLDISASQPL